MIIVSQDKNKIVNFDNIAHIFISKDSDKHYLIEYGKMNGSSELLGIYATEERAKEVLQEIINKYKKPKILQETLDAYQVIKFNNEVFQMSKE